MKILLAFLILFLSVGNAYAADTKLTDLTADASPTGDDLIYTVNDPGGTPASRKATITNLATVVDTNAVKEYWWPASATLPLSPSVVSGIPPIAKIAGINVETLVTSFDDSTDECRTIHLKIPSDISSIATVTFRNVWFSQTATTNSTVWDWRCQNNGVDGVTFDTVTILTEATCDTAGTVNQRDVCTTSRLASELSWTANKDVSCLVCRNANLAADNMVGDAQLYGVGIEIPRS